MPRASLISAKRIEAIAKAILGGASMGTAPRFGGVSKATHHNWMRRGAEAIAAIPDGKDESSIPEGELPFVEYLHAVTRAREDWEAAQVASIQEFATGVPWEEVVSVVKSGPEGVEETTTVRRGVNRDWRAPAWLLERRDPQKWGRRVTELQGKDGAELTFRVEWPSAKRESGDEG